MVSFHTLNTISRSYNLTPREREVVFYISMGRNGATIATAMNISYNTVKSHLKNIYSKCDIRSRQNLVDLLYQEQSENPF